MRALLYAALLLVMLVFWSASASAAQASDKVLILGSTVSGGSGSPEGQAVTNEGLEPEVVSDEQWQSMSEAQFHSYRAIVMGDPTCGRAAPQAAEDTTSTWGPAVDGNVMIVGSDPVYHGRQQVTDTGIQYATAQSGKTGAYVTLSCYYHDTDEHTGVAMLNGFHNGGFSVRGVGCYNDAHITATDSALNGLTDDYLSNWSCSVHEGFDSYPSDFVVLAMAKDIGATYTAPDGTVGTPYILARGSGTSYFGRSYIALGDSVAAGEGIGYGWHWDNSQRKWVGGDNNGSWDSTYRTTHCHQTTESFPWVAKDLLSADLKNLACTGASAYGGVLGNQDGDGPQLGSSTVPGAEAPNSHYDDAKPDVVSLTLGADDVHFADIVKDCYLDGCGTDPHRLDATLAEEKKNLGLVLDEIHRRGVADGKVPLVVVTQYYDPFPAFDKGCIDLNPPAWFVGLNNKTEGFLVDGLARLNKNIKDQADAHGAVLLSTSALFRDHRYCSSDPWVYGPSIESLLHHSSAAPFHPTPDGQAAIGAAFSSVVSQKLPVRTGDSVGVSLPHGQLQFSHVDTSGEATILPGSALQGSIPPSNTFKQSSSYYIQSSAGYTGGITISLPSTTNQSLFHFTDGAWHQVPSSWNGTYVQGTVTSLSPFALGDPVSPVHAQATNGGGGRAPAAISFNGTGSNVEDASAIASYDWDFGDGNTGTGPTPTHTYAMSGTYRATLTVTAANGAVDQATTEVAVINAPPTAVLSGPSTGRVGQVLTFGSSGSSDPNGGLSEARWDFGDGSDPVRNGQVSHVFTTPGTYTLRLEVRDDEGEPDVVTMPVTITAADVGTPTTPLGPGPDGGHPAATPAISVGTRVARDKKGRLFVSVHCLKRARCRGSVRVQVRRKRKLATVATAAYNAKAGKTVTVRVRPKRSIAHVARRARKVKVIAKVIGGLTVARTCSVKARK